MDDESDLCECECHENNSMVHCFPCCAECMYCGDYIAIHLYDIHLRRHCLALTLLLTMGESIE